MRRFALLALAAACTDYSLNPQGDKSLPAADTGALTDTAGDGGAGGGGDGGRPEDCGDIDVPDPEALTQADACEFEEQTGTFTPVVEWTKQSFSVDPSSNNVMMMPAVASLTDDDGDGDIDEDDVPDIIFITYGSYGTLRAVSGDDGREIFSVVGQQLQGQGAVAVGDIDGDGVVEIVAPTSRGLKAFENDGTLKWVSSSVGSALHGTSDAPSISDMDGDGSPEIIVGSAIFNADGTLRGKGAHGRAGVSSNVGTCSVAVDIDGDGTQELVVGNALYRPDGSTIWYNGEADGYVAVGNFDSDSKGEIVVSGEGRVRLQDDDGTVLWRASIPGAGTTYYGGPPTIADFDGDGEPEVGVAANSSYNVFDTDGSLLWQKPTQDASSGNTASAVFDFEGDGVAEAVYADETRLWVFSGPDGSVKLESTAHSNATWLEYAVIADVDADGAAEIVVPNTAYLASYYGITVIGDADDSWRSGRRIWNQHAYHITNVEDDGTIPAVADRNWLTYNNFRSGDLTAGNGTAAPDLVVEITSVCGLECDEDRLYVTLRAGNRGYEDVNGEVSVELYGETDAGEVLLAETAVDGVPAGAWAAGETLVIEGVAEMDPILDLIARVDGGNDADNDGDWPECDESNNEDTWGEDVCW